jgi:ABC-2 type transport system permease protein
MRREGSPFQGLGVVFLKELSDHLTSARMRVLEFLVVIVAVLAINGAIEQIREVTAEDPFLFLRLFTTAKEPWPPFSFFLMFLVPLIAIGLGFDSVNGEYNRRTLSRILAQPIYRDALLFGKFLGALTAVTISMVVLWLLIIGFGLYALGIPPNGEEILRMFAFLVATIFYAGIWLGLAMLFSILFRSAATAAMVTLGLWLVLTLMWSLVAQTIATALIPPDTEGTQIVVAQTLARLSPVVLFQEVIQVILNPSTRALGPVTLQQIHGMVPGAPLPLVESLLIAWPQLVGLIAGTIMLFVIGYVVFQRQEVRA